MGSFLSGNKDKRIYRKVFNHVFLVMPNASNKYSINEKEYIQKSRP
jgi:hypothetical protein